MCAEWRGADCCQAAGWPSPLSIRSETRNTRIREYEPPAFPLGASLFLSVERALGEVLQSGTMWTAVRRQAGHPHSILGLKHVVQLRAPSCSAGCLAAPLFEEGGGEGCQELVPAGGDLLLMTGLPSSYSSPSEL